MFELEDLQPRVSFSLLAVKILEETFQGCQCWRHAFPMYLQWLRQQPPHLLRDLKQGLRLKNDCEIVARNLSRVNIFLDKKVLTVSQFQLGNVWSRDVFRPIFINLEMQGAFHSTKSPRTSKTGANCMEYSEERFPEIRKLLGHFPF